VGQLHAKTKLLDSSEAAYLTSAACLSFADGSFAASFLYVGMLFLKSSTQSLRLGRSLQRKQAKSELDQLIRPSRMTMWQSPVFLDLMIMNSLRIIRAHIKLGQRKLARVQVFQLTGHRSCTGLQMAKMLLPLHTHPGWLEIELSETPVGSSFAIPLQRRC